MARYSDLLDQLHEPKLRKNGSLIAFSKKLMWSLEEIRIAGTNSILYAEDKLWYNGLTASLDEPQFGKHDVLVAYEGGSYGTELLATLTCRLFCHLFYVELVSLPMFLGKPLKCRVRLLCRLPPGPPLMDLLVRLDERKAQVYFSGHEARYDRIILCTEAAMSRCREGRPFERTLEVEVLSPESAVDIRIDQLSAEPQSISNCPYKLHKLVRDQKLDCVFGSDDHRFGVQSENGTRWSRSMLEDEITVLGRTLQRIGSC